MAEQLQWTDQQKRAITSRGSDVLVTASAGTGKTAVLSGRCVGIVADRSLCPDVSGILVLTFTEAAAEQMRSRIAERLKAAFLEGRKPHLRRQLVLLQGADIGTIHSFCKRLITEHFYILGLDPTFGVLDADEAGLLKAEVLEKTIDWAWDQPNLVIGLEQLLSRRSLRTKDGFLTRIAEVSNFLDTVISRRSWCERAALLAGAVDPVTSPLGQKQMQVVARSLNDIVARLRCAAGLYKAHVSDGDWPEKFHDAFIKPVTACIELLEGGDWPACAERIRSFHRPAFRTPKEPPEAISEIIRNMVHKAYHSFDELSHLAVVNPDYLDRLGAPVSLQTRLLIELVKKFDRLYARAKRLLNCLDFADLEHHALKLLTDPESPQDTLVPSPTALALRQRYRYIFVDEYQDINSVQQAILNTLSGGDNLFVVGDVKQSIYAWRGAEPQIFLERLRVASVNPVDAAQGLRVDLNANFRSSRGILDFVNRVFSRIMKSPRLAGFDYDESARLTPATERQSADSRSGDKTPVVELHLLDERAAGQETRDEHSDPATDEELDVVTARRRQAAMIARRIRRITGADTGRPEFQIYDKERDAVRDVRYGDIVVLMRSLAKKANDYVEILRLAGVPVSCEATAGYFEATEISDILSLLKILDNPQRDIELAAVMRSPLFKVSDTELARIRLHGKAGQPMNLYHCALRYCQSGPDAALAGKLEEALARLDGWRTTARRGDLADLIWRVYRETSYLSFVSALPNGRARRANLLRLHDRAIQFEGFAGSAVVPSLTRFVEFIEKLQEAGQDWAPAEPEAAAGNAVRILSVHKSKGLEFPVVFLAELGAMFNISDARSDCLADADDTLGLQVIDRDSNSRLRSLAHEVIADGKLGTSLAEEMRILYVATTRAKDRLILTASQKRLSCRQIISAGLFFGPEGIPDWQLRSCRSALEWLLYALSDQKILHDAFETGLSASALDDDLFSFRLHDPQQLQRLSQFVVSLKAGKPHRPFETAKKSSPNKKQSALLAKIKSSLAWQYPFEDAPLLPAKSSVTQITHLADEYVGLDYSAALERHPAALAGAECDSAGRIEPRLLGTAAHLVISRLELAGPPTEKTIEQTIDALVHEKALSPRLAERIDTGSIAAFFQTAPGRTALDLPDSVLREWPFTFAVPASRFHPADVTTGPPTDETVVVQGIIDMLVRTAHGLVVIDFKTDNVTAARIPERARLHRRQLDLYADAATAILESPLFAKWLYFLSARRAVEVTH